MTLLYLANQTGRKMSKLAFVEAEYLRAIIVKGQIPLKESRTIPSIMIMPIQSQTSLSILFMITA